MKYIIIGIISSILFISCEVTEFDLQESPTDLKPSQVDEFLLTNRIQLVFGEFIEDMNTNTEDIMRYMAMRETYTDAASSGVLNGEYQNVYALRENFNILKSLIPEGEQEKRKVFARGVARIAHAYAVVTLVDYLGTPRHLGAA